MSASVACDFLLQNSIMIYVVYNMIFFVRAARIQPLSLSLAFAGYIDQLLLYLPAALPRAMDMLSLPYLKPLLPCTLD